MITTYLGNIPSCFENHSELVNLWNQIWKLKRTDRFDECIELLANKLGQCSLSETIEEMFFRFMLGEVYCRIADYQSAVRVLHANPDCGDLEAVFLIQTTRYYALRELDNLEQASLLLDSLTRQIMENSFFPVRWDEVLLEYVYQQQKRDFFAETLPAIKTIISSPNAAPARILQAFVRYTFIFTIGHSKNGNDPNEFMRDNDRQTRLLRVLDDMVEHPLLQEYRLYSLCNRAEYFIAVGRYWDSINDYSEVINSALLITPLFLSHEFHKYMAFRQRAYAYEMLGKRLEAAVDNKIANEIKRDLREELVLMRRA